MILLLYSFELNKMLCTMDAKDTRGYILNVEELAWPIIEFNNMQDVDVNV